MLFTSQAVPGGALHVTLRRVAPFCQPTACPWLLQPPRLPRRCLPRRNTPYRVPFLPPEQVFATPKRHHKSKPFFDHVLSFSVADGRIWLRNYQVGLACTAVRLN